jgi:SNF2 family DNA or RNA helicase
MYRMIEFLANFNIPMGRMALKTPELVEYLSTHAFKRNTKDTIKEEHTLPPIKEEIQWLKFSDTERMMYNAFLANPNNDKYSVYLRQLCCHPQLADETKLALSNCKTLKDIEKMMVAHYEQDVEKATGKVNSLQKRIDIINKRIKKLKKQKKKMAKKNKKKSKANNKNKKKGKKYESNSDEYSDSSSESDSGSESDSDNDEILNQLLAGIYGDEDMVDSEDNNNNDKLQKKQLSIDNLETTLAELETKMADAQDVLNGKTATCNFFKNVIAKLRNTVNQDDDSNQNENQNKKEAQQDLVAKELGLISDDEDNENDNDNDNDNDNEAHDNENYVGAEECAICLDTIPEDDVGVTKCGHIYCYECLKLVIQQSHRCPYCRKQLKDSEIYMLSYERKKKTKQTKEEIEKDDLINDVGTKLANLIFFLIDSDTHTILFSQWDDLLRKVGTVLDTYNIKNIFCRGNVYQRDKAIRRFNDENDIKVIMLSSESAASGTNLTKASQVVFLDPIYGEYQHRKDTEMQAIGRAHRLGQTEELRVVRFIIKNTIESEIYEQNVEQDKKEQEILAKEAEAEENKKKKKEKKEKKVQKESKVKKIKKAVKKVVSKVK